MLVELPPEIAILRFGVFALDLRRRELRREGRPVRLAKLPFEGLRLLAAHPQVVLGREELIAVLWPGQLADRNENLDDLMRKVRAALGDSPYTPRFLQTVRGVGFCFLAEVTRVPAEPPPMVEDVPSATEPIPVVRAAPEAIRSRWRGRIAAIVAAGVASLLALAAGAAWLAAARTAPSLHVRGDWVELTHDGLQKKGRIFIRGSWIYFTEVREGRYRVVRVPAAGGVAEPVAEAWPDSMLLGISPQGESLLIVSPVPNDPARSDAPLWILKKDGAHRLGNFTAHAAAFSPDGTATLLAHANALYLADANGLHPRRWLGLPAEPTALAWSPNSTQVRFVQIANPDQAPTEWEVRRDGSHLQQLGSTGSTRSVVDEAWRPDGRGSLLVTDATENWEFPAGGSWGWRTLRPRSIALGLVSKSPQAAFDASMRFLYRVGSAIGGDLIRYDAATQQFLPVAPGLSIGYVDYSPQGDMVAYTSAPDGPLWRASADFSHPQRLTPPGLRTELPRWSPDGRWIAFMAQTTVHPWNLDMVAATGGASQVLAIGTANGGMGAPTWSPNGGSLYFGRVNCPDPAACGIERLDLRTRVLTTLPGSMGLRTARISPDGHYIAALSATHTIEICDLRTSRWWPLAAAGTEDVLAWSRDSQYVYAFAPPGAPPRIVRIRLRDGATEPVVNLAALGAAPDLVSYWFGLDPRERPIVYRATESDEIFAARLGTQ